MKILEEEIKSETGFQYIFIKDKKSKRLQYRLIPAIHDDGFHLFDIAINGIISNKDPFKVLVDFYNRRNKFLTIIYGMRTKSNTNASLPASNWPHPVKTGSVLL